MEQKFTGQASVGTTGTKTEAGNTWLSEKLEEVMPRLSWEGPWQVCLLHRLPGKALASPTNVFLPTTAGHF